MAVPFPFKDTLNFIRRKVNDNGNVADERRFTDNHICGFITRSLAKLERNSPEAFYPEAAAIPSEDELVAKDPAEYSLTETGLSRKWIPLVERAVVRDLEGEAAAGARPVAAAQENAEIVQQPI